MKFWFLHNELIDRFIIKLRNFYERRLQIHFLGFDDSIPSPDLLTPFLGPPDAELEPEAEPDPEAGAPRAVEPAPLVTA